MKRLFVKENRCMLGGAIVVRISGLYLYRSARPMRAGSYAAPNESPYVFISERYRVTRASGSGLVVNDRRVTTCGSLDLFVQSQFYWAT